jgi:hypothetical protein
MIFSGLTTAELSATASLGGLFLVGSGWGGGLSACGMPTTPLGPPRPFFQSMFAATTAIMATTIRRGPGTRVR